MGKKVTTKRTILTIQDMKIPVQVHFERRNNVRVSIGKKAIHLRMPSTLPIKDQQKHWEWCKNWVAKQFEKDKKLHHRFVPKSYKTGDNISVFNRKYYLNISFEERQTHSAKLRDNIIYLKLAVGEQQVEKIIKTLLSRTISQDCLQEFEQRVDEWNDAHFQENISNIRLKYNQSNWGSCSSKSNLNFSSRLLFAPSEVIDYVIVHELSHLKEMNHSPKFWAIVQKVMPNYKIHEKWLDDNGHLCDF